MHPIKTFSIVHLYRFERIHVDITNLLRCQWMCILFGVFMLPSRHLHHTHPYLQLISTGEGACSWGVLPILRTFSLTASHGKHSWERYYKILQRYSIILNDCVKESWQAPGNVFHISEVARHERQMPLLSRANFPLTSFPLEDCQLCNRTLFPCLLKAQLLMSCKPIQTALMNRNTCPPNNQHSPKTMQVDGCWIAPPCIHLIVKFHHHSLKSEFWCTNHYLPGYSGRERQCLLTFPASALCFHMWFTIYCFHQSHISFSW